MRQELKDIKLLMESGSLTGASAANTPLMGGWILTFKGRKAKDLYTLYGQRGEPRAFKTLDAAAKVVKELGFADMGVDLT